MTVRKTNPQSGSLKPWLSEDFAERFKEAFGREMTADEREFFGLEPLQTDPDEYAEAAD
jgi:hypothetical protein